MYGLSSTFDGMKTKSLFFRHFHSLPSMKTSLMYTCHAPPGLVPHMKYGENHFTTNAMFVVLLRARSFWRSVFFFIVLVISSTAITSYSVEKYLSFLLSSCQYHKMIMLSLKCIAFHDILYPWLSSSVLISFGSLSSRVSLISL